jgi:hypothetical protein
MSVYGTRLNVSIERLHSKWITLTIGTKKMEDKENAITVKNRCLISAVGANTNSAQNVQKWDSLSRMETVVTKSFTFATIE